MVKITRIICDVIGCDEEGYREVDCCKGWTVSDGIASEKKRYRKLEKPIPHEKTDLCKEHWKKWSKLTCKLLKMDKERKVGVKSNGNV